MRFCAAASCSALCLTYALGSKRAPFDRLGDGLRDRTPPRPVLASRPRDDSRTLPRLGAGDGARDELADDGRLDGRLPAGERPFAEPEPKPTLPRVGEGEVADNGRREAGPRREERVESRTRAPLRESVLPLERILPPPRDMRLIV